MIGWPYFLLIHLRLNLRNKQAFFFSYLFPLFFLFLYGSVIARGNPKALGLLMPLLLTLTALTGSLFGLPLGMVVARERGILRRYRLTPLPGALIVAANIFTGYLSMLIAATYLMLLARWIYGVQFGGSLLYGWVFLTLTFMVFAGLGMVIACYAETAQAAPAIAQLIFLPMMMFSGMLFPLEYLPTWAQRLAQFLPGGYAVHGIREALIHGDGPIANWRDSAILLTGAAVAIFIASQLFRWEQGEKVQPAGKRWALAAVIPYALAGLMVERGHLLSTNTLLERVLEPQARRVALVGGLVIDGTGRAPIRRGVIVIGNGLIGAVAPEGAATIPPDAQIIDLTGKTVLPGLIDAHVHLEGDPVRGMSTDPSMDTPARGRVQAIQALRADLYCGVTTVRDLGSRFEPIWLLRQQEIDEEIPAPHMVLAGPMIAGARGEPLPPDRLSRGLAAEACREVASPAAARQIVGDLATRLVDVVKVIYQEGPGPTAGGVPSPARLRRDVLHVLVEEAHGRGLRVVAHTGSCADVRGAVEAGVDGVEHGAQLDLLDGATLGLLARRHTFYSPTLAVFESLSRAAGEFEVDPLAQQTLPRADLALLRRPGNVDDEAAGGPAAAAAARAALAVGTVNLRRCYERGVRLCLGTDAGNPLTFPGAAVHREMELWVAAGVAPIDALMAATRTNAEALGRAHTLGTLEYGKAADILVVNGDPTRDISATRAIAMVIKGSRIFRREQLVSNRN